MAKYIIVGMLIGGLLAIIGTWGWLAILVAMLVLGVVSFMDWSGQGDGREGCNRHTSCSNH